LHFQPSEDDDAILGQNLHLIRPDPRHVDSWFLSGFLATDGPRPRQMRRAGRIFGVAAPDLFCMWEEFKNSEVG